ncbi:TetR/AcrR family transcriptional regulator [Nocardia sp. NPDC048505]|uniref:TetR/AcrR family transcriptional regulator n=1 Tax=unclassified Nocardia TaxID=2637762 RepID=UPI0033E4ABEE
MSNEPVRRGADRTDAIMQAALDLGREVGYAKLSMEAVASRAGAGKHTLYRRWPSKGALLLDALLSLHQPALTYPDTGDLRADLREQTRQVVDQLAAPPMGPLLRTLIGEAQNDPAVATALKERFIDPTAERLIARLATARDAGQLSPDVDLGLAMALLSGPLYYRFLIAHEPLTHEFADAVFDALFAGIGPRPRFSGA